MDRPSSRNPRTKPSPTCSTTRYSARYLILVYSETSARFDPLEIRRLASRWRAQCTIVRQTRPNDSTHNHLAFVDFIGKRFQTRNRNFFDIQGYHPKWLHLTSSPWRHLEQMMERGEVIWNGVSRQSQESRKRGTSVTAKEPSIAGHSLSIPLSEGDWEFLGAASSESAFLDLCEASEMPKGTVDMVAQMFEQTSGYESSRGETEISRNVRFWQDGFRAGYEAAREFSFGDLKGTGGFDVVE
ncbi:hypothetical protein QBC34DRAFT_401441 [Podospora aff. communis PSN243]|uniref:Uncharacterized protein n=1 Tax=Podospora aff. communis PSN243 TaxID=3040156 RepID=A0AAV9GSD8_9PEZI|nr:hypothetical protein QBC34DRAFT_401441 [Podospora aff. communis PSN243]